jgi:hypothetical protein
LGVGGFADGCSNKFGISTEVSWSFKYVIFPETVPAEGIRRKRIFNVFQNSTMQVAKRQWGRSWDVSVNFSMSLDKYGNFAQTIPLTAAVEGSGLSACFRTAP